MNALSTRIQSLDDAQAEQVLQSVARYRLGSKQAEEIRPDGELRNALANEAMPEATVSSGELARTSLLLLAEEEELRGPIESLIDNPPAQSFDPSLGVFTVGMATLVILQTDIKFERKENGKWSISVKKKPLNADLLKAVIAKLGGWLKGN
jgi:hypothetical protein